MASEREVRAPRRVERFHLNGPSIRLDARVHAVRRDIADIDLADRLFAPHYARAELFACSAPHAMLREAPRHSSCAVSQLLHGESFAVLDVAGGWAWGYGLHDRYVGYVPAGLLGDVCTSTHVVTAPLALVFLQPDIKSAVVACWPIGSRFEGEAEGDFLASGAGYIHMRHASSLDDPAGDPVDFAERLVGTPYLWGGRGGSGFDCSGLVQLGLGLCGISSPRDTDQQRESLGVPLDDDVPHMRGELIFFPGHVGLMADETNLVHANAHWMAVVVEPLADVVTRLAANGSPGILVRRRLQP